MSNEANVMLVLKKIMEAMRSREVNWKPDTTSTIKFMKNITSINDEVMNVKKLMTTWDFQQDGQIPHNEHQEFITKLIETEMNKNLYNSF